MVDQKSALCTQAQPTLKKGDLVVVGEEGSGWILRQPRQLSNFEFMHGTVSPERPSETIIAKVAAEMIALKAKEGRSDSWGTCDHPYRSRSCTCIDYPERVSMSSLPAMPLPPMTSNTFTGHHLAWTSAQENRSQEVIKITCMPFRGDAGGFDKSDRNRVITGGIM